MLHILPLATRRKAPTKPRLVQCEEGQHAESSAMAMKRASPPQKLSRWTSPPRTVLLVQKPDDERTTQAMGLVLSHLAKTAPHLNLLVEPHTARDHPSHADKLTVVEQGDEPLLERCTDLVVTIGGDGTILHVSHLFAGGECPAVLSFSMGTLGFLLPFHIDTLAPALEMTLNGPVSILQRMRLACTPLSADGEVLPCTGIVGQAGIQVMNEVTLHRGQHPHLTVIDAYFDEQHLTEAVADGLLLSTPTGSTAYSLSAGGPISHPETDAFLLTPIAPRSLSFRTVVLPGRGSVRLEISTSSRSPAELSIDGRQICHLRPKESVVISKSPYPIPCVERSEGGTGWVRDINSLLQFNTGFRNKSLMGHSIA
ncbi:NADH kinase [Dioszegia hungarica]|uniref:NADH kinase n=1 Tax=Dioszegia hungarica TaxID=4972 RepID=A0AA38H8X1_9TREE|nr:NADH kinase [Dioszegia hungarica]KAI9635134.1 NADH kinase [Dioszegia hungarica]